MGAALKKLNGMEKKRAIIVECYKEYVKNYKEIETKEDFYYFVCKVVEELNRRYGYTQIKIPDKEKLKGKFKEHMKDEEFLTVCQSLIYELGYTNLGALYPVLFILSAPAVALFVKKVVNHPRPVSDQVLIPGVTSATVLLLASLKRI